MRHMTQYIRFHQLRIHVSFKIHRFEMMQFSPMFTQEPAMGFCSANEAWLLFWQLPDSAASNMISSSTVLRQRLLILIPLYYLLASPVETFLRGEWPHHDITWPMWAAQTTLLAPTVTLSPMVIGKKAMFPWQATNLDYTGFWTTVLLQQMDFFFITGMSHSWLNWNIRSMLVVNMCQQSQWCLITAGPVYKGSQNGACSLTFPLLPQHTYSSTQLHDDSLFLLDLFAHFSPSKCLMSPLCLPAMFPPCTSCMRVLRRNFRRWSHVCLRHQRIRGYRGNRWPSKKSHKKHKKGPSKKNQI